MVFILAVLGGLGWVGWQFAVGGSIPGLSFLLPGSGPQPARVDARGGEDRGPEPTSAPAEVVVDDVAVDGELAEVGDVPVEIEPEAAPEPAGPPEPRGLVGLLTRLEQLGRQAGVSCGAIEMSGEDARSLRLGGTGGLAAVTTFLARLEQDARFLGVSELQVSSTAPGLVGFELEVLLAAESTAADAAAVPFAYASWTTDADLPDVFVPPRPAETEARAVLADAQDADDGPSPPADASDEPVAPAPTQPVVTTPVAFAPPSWPAHSVSVVLVGPGAPRAVVDSLVVQVGDRIEAGEVVRIHERGVVVRASTVVLEYALGAPRSPPQVLAEVAEP